MKVGIGILLLLLVRHRLEKQPSPFRKISKMEKIEALYLVPNMIRTRLMRLKVGKEYESRYYYNY